MQTIKELMNSEGRHFQQGDYDSDDDFQAKKLRVGDQVDFYYEATATSIARSGWRTG